MNFNEAKKIAQDILSSSLILSLFTLFLSAYITYLFTKRKYKNEKIQDIKMKSLEGVYLPIYKKLEYINIKKIERNDVISLYVFIKSKVEKNYLYTNPTFYSLLKDLKMVLDNNKNYIDLLSRIKLHTKYEYNKLRKQLGFPTYSVILTFKYLSTGEKIILLCYYSFVSLCASIYVYNIINRYVEILSIPILFWFLLSFMSLFIFMIIGMIYLILLKIKSRKNKDYSCIK